MLYNERVQIEGTTEHVVDTMLLFDSTNTEGVLESTTIVQETQMSATTTGTDVLAHGTITDINTKLFNVTDDVDVVQSTQTEVFNLAAITSQKCWQPEENLHVPHGRSAYDIIKRRKKEARYCC